MPAILCYVSKLLSRSCRVRCAIPQIMYLNQSMYTYSLYHNARAHFLTPRHLLAMNCVWHYGIAATFPSPPMTRLQPSFPRLTIVHSLPITTTCQPRKLSPLLSPLRSPKYLPALSRKHYALLCLLNHTSSLVAAKPSRSSSPNAIIPRLYRSTLILPPGVQTASLPITLRVGESCQPPPGTSFNIS